MSRRLRLSLLATASALALLGATALIAVFVMLRPERFTRILKDGAQAAGLQLVLGAPAHATLWPQPGVRLQGLQLYVRGRSEPLLVANSGRIVVPWRTLLGSATAITTLQLDTPRLDLGQLRYALAKLSGDASVAPRMPRIDTGITIHDGALVRDSRMLLQHIDLHTGALVPNQAFTLDAEARDQGAPARLLKLSFTPRRADDQAIALDAIKLVMRAGNKPRMELDGKGRWLGGSRLMLDLAGQWRDGEGKPYRMALTGQPATDGPQDWQLKVDGPTASADLRLSPARLAAWWRGITGPYTPGPLPTPPLDGTLSAERVDVGDLHVQGLTVTSGDALPAAGASAAPPAGTGK